MLKFQILFLLVCSFLAADVSLAKGRKADQVVGNPTLVLRSIDQDAILDVCLRKFNLNAREDGTFDPLPTWLSVYSCSVPILSAGEVMVDSWSTNSSVHSSAVKLALNKDKTEKFYGGMVFKGRSLMIWMTAIHYEGEQSLISSWNQDQTRQAIRRIMNKPDNQPYFDKGFYVLTTKTSGDATYSSASISK